MAKQNALHELIKSLDSTEKAYFKKYAYRMGSSKSADYLFLFDLIDKQEDYEEASILKKLKGKSLTKQFPAAKHYLYQLILRCLEDYHRNKSLHSKIRHLLEQAEILRKKRLFKQSHNLLLKAKQIAMEQEAMTHYFDILRVEQQLTLKRDPVFLDEQRKQENEFIAIYRNRSEFRSLYYLLFREFRHYAHIRDPKELPRLEKLMHNPLLSSEKNALSFQAKNNFHSLHANFYALKGDHQSRYEARKNQLHLWNSNPQQHSNQQIAYVRVWCNFAEAALRINEFEEVEHAIESLSAIKPDSKNHKTEIFEAIWDFRLKLATAKKEFEKAYSFIDELEQVIEQQQLPIRKDFLYSFAGQKATICFFHGDLERSLSYQLEIINQIDDNYQQDLQVAMRLMNLITHFELGHEAIIDRVFKSTYRYLLRRKQLYRYERTVISALRKTASLPLDLRLRIPVLERLKQDLDDMRNDPFEDHAFQFFDAGIWLEKKLGTKERA